MASFVVVAVVVVVVAVVVVVVVVGRKWRRTMRHNYSEVFFYSYPPIVPAD